MEEYGLRRCMVGSLLYKNGTSKKMGYRTCGIRMLFRLRSVAVVVGIKCYTICTAVGQPFDN